VVRRGDGFEERGFGRCVFVPLIGAAAYDEEDSNRSRRHWPGPFAAQGTDRAGCERSPISRRRRDLDPGAGAI
jgi:hypothetical protein